MQRAVLALVDRAFPLPQLAGGARSPRTGCAPEDSAADVRIQLGTGESSALSDDDKRELSRLTALWVRA